MGSMHRRDHDHGQGAVRPERPLRLTPSQVGDSMHSSQTASSAKKVVLRFAGAHLAQ